MVTKTTQKGTAGAFFIIAMLLGTMVYMDLTTDVHPLGSIEDDAIYVDSHTVYVGQEVLFKIKPAILGDEYGINYFMWDWHDGSYIEVSTREEVAVAHIFDQPGEFTVSVLALRGNQSRIFTIPMSVTPEPQQVIIDVSDSSVFEDEVIQFSATGTGIYTPFTNILWEWGDGQTSFGARVNHSYTEEGLYTVRVKAYTNNSLYYTEYLDIDVSNQVPDVTFAISSASVDEDEVVTFTSGVSDSQSDLDTMKYIWSFGDGLMAKGSVVDHIYTKDGSYTITLTAIDNNGARKNISRSLQVVNKVPVIHNLWNFRNTFVEGETVTTFANLTESESDFNFLDYNWGVPGSGTELSTPNYENGIFTVDFAVTDDDGANDTAYSDLIEVINTNPFVSLISASSNFSVEFKIWGTVGSTANITIFKNNEEAYNFSITNVDEERNVSRIAYLIEDLQQPLDEYWDILINMNDTIPPFDTYVEVKFLLANNQNVTTTNHCSSETDRCVSDSYRLPIAPLDRGFPITYTFSVFDPGNDNLNVSMHLGENYYSTFVARPEYGPTTGTASITGYLPEDQSPNSIYYYVEDEDGGRSKSYYMPFLDYLKQQPPPEFTNETAWEYWGHYISHYAPVAIWTSPSDLDIGNQYDLTWDPMHPDIGSLEYLWNFGTGDTSKHRYPSYAYNFKGEYLVWTIIMDDYYEHVEYTYITTKNPFSEVFPNILGNPVAGNDLTFIVSGLPDSPPKDQLRYYWDFGDGSDGFGSRFKHAYTHPGNYTVLLTVIDRYNIRDTIEYLVMIFNAPPFNEEELPTSLEISEGTNIIYTPTVQDSPYDTLHLEYNWIVNGNEYNTASLWLKTAQPMNFGNLLVTDINGANFTYYFSFNVSSNPFEITAPVYHHLYGDPATTMNIIGTISPSIFMKNTYKTDTSIEYLLYDKNGVQIQSGNGSLVDDFYGFSVLVDTSEIGSDQLFDDLRSQIIVPEDLTEDITPSGSYRVVLRLLNENNAVIASTATTLLITIDKDADFITDELEILYSQTIEDLDFDIHLKDTDDDGIADPVEYVLGNDKDGDGLPALYEEIYGTSDDNPDTDGDGLTDGFGPYGEIQLGTDATDPDTDGDRLDDGEEISGWQIELITPKGLIVKDVTSDPTSSDTDHDGVIDFYEFNLKIDPRNADTDFDGLNDLDEQDYGTSLLNKDTDFDGISDFDEITKGFTTTYYDAEGLELSQTYYLNPLSPDSDEDNITDYDEAFVYGSIGTNKDSDRDGINDYDEIFIYNTETNNADTDGDGLADGIEVTGFDIPVVLISKGVYSENGTVITQPEVSNYTISITTDPLKMDTDGDGLTDWEELVGDPDNVGDPTSVDSDGDGILDLWDPQRLISDYTPANISSEIEVIYNIRPGQTTNTVVKWLDVGLSTVWDLMKNVGSLVIDLLNSFWYLKRVCVVFCVDIPWLHSISQIGKNIETAIVRFVKANVDIIWPLAKDFGQIYWDTLKFPTEAFTIRKSAGIPIGIDFTGGLSVMARKVVDTITEIVDPLVNIQFDIEDEAGIDKIIIYQDGANFKTIENINSKEFRVNEFFTLQNEGFSLDTTTILFEIHDINGNIRMIERTTEVKTFGGVLLAAGVTLIKETAEHVIHKLKDVVSWVWDKLQQFGQTVLDTVNEVAKFVDEVTKKVADWIMKQFDKVWEGFVRDAMNLLLAKGKEYLDRSGELFQTIIGAYTTARGEIVDTVDTIMEGPVVSIINNTLSNLSSMIDEFMPPINASAITEAINGFIDPIMEFFNGTVIYYAILILSGEALEILIDIVRKQVEDIVKKVLGNYYDTLVRIFQEIIEQIAPEQLPGMDFDIDIAKGADGIIETFVNLINLMRNPATALVNLLNSVNGDNLMSWIDKFLLDDPKYLISLNDIIFTMLKPVAAVGLVFYDILNFASSTISNVSSFYRLNDVHAIRLELSSPSQGIEHLFDEIYSIVSSVIKLADLAFNEVMKILEASDKISDKDVDSPLMMIKSGVGMAIWVLTDGFEAVVCEINRSARSANESNSVNVHDCTCDSTTEEKEFAACDKTSIIAFAKILILVGSFFKAATILRDYHGKPDKEDEKNGEEFKLTWISDILSWLLNMVDTFWSTGLFIAYTIIAGNVTEEEFSLEFYELAASWLNMFYDPLSGIFEHGNKIAGVELKAIYHAFAAFTVLMTAITIITGLIMGIVGIISPSVV
ncbi:MAG: PKD domain-containing protein [Candidatus Kariarchaeaceae archaeon]|jgi:PKD repeat protein